MNLGRFVDVAGYGRVEWAVIGLHALVAALFLAGAVQTVMGGGALAGAGLQTLVAALVAALGFVVASLLSRQ